MNDYQEFMDLCAEKILSAKSKKDILNIRLAARLKWEEYEMGGIDNVQFAYRNNSPIVPPGHCGHPIELVRRGFVDGKGWPEKDGTFRKLS